jgi:soluble lytic murein transglycosylase-like protein
MKLRLQITLRLPRAAETAGICCSLGMLSFLTSTALNSKPAEPVVIAIPYLVPSVLATAAMPPTPARKAVFKSKRRPSGWCAPISDGEIASIIDRNALAHGVDRELVGAVISVESSGDPCAVSHAGAAGLMQLTPATARQYGVRNVFDPAESIAAGTKHLQWLLKRYDSDLSLALAAYNAGAGTVDRSGGIPPISETQQYVKKVLKLLADDDSGGQRLRQ